VKIAVLILTRCLGKSALEAKGEIAISSFVIPHTAIWQSGLLLRIDFRRKLFLESLESGENFCIDFASSLTNFGF
jgi:hypothetical protein